MEVKLFKREDDFYSLKVDGIVMATSNGMLVDHKLSLKNCQAIENGYDLNELAIEYFKQIHMGFGILEAYKKGFQKALSILGNKKFSEEQLRFAYNRGSYDDRLNNKKLFNADKYIQSLQQTEWDVEIVEEQVYDGLDEMAQPQYVKQSKLDEKGQLILKRK